MKGVRNWRLNQNAAGKSILGMKAAASEEGLEFDALGGGAEFAQLAVIDAGACPVAASALPPTRRFRESECRAGLVSRKLVFRRHCRIELHQFSARLCIPLEALLSWAGFFDCHARELSGGFRGGGQRDPDGVGGNGFGPGGGGGGNENQHISATDCCDCRTRTLPASMQAPLSSA